MSSDYSSAAHLLNRIAFALDPSITDTPDSQRTPNRVAPVTTVISSAPHRSERVPVPVPSTLREPETHSEVTPQTVPMSRDRLKLPFLTGSTARRRASTQSPVPNPMRGDRDPSPIPGGIHVHVHLEQREDLPSPPPKNPRMAPSTSKVNDPKVKTSGHPQRISSSSPSRVQDGEIDGIPISTILAVLPDILERLRADEKAVFQALGKAPPDGTNTNIDPVQDSDNGSSIGRCLCRSNGQTRRRSQV